MSIQQFKSNLTGGGARPNQFRVEVNFPSIAVGAATAGRAGQFLISAASLPSSTIGIAPVFYRGREVKLAGDRTFAPWTITILNDTNFLLRNAFESWSDRINDLDANTGITDPRLYVAPMSVHQLGRNNEILKTYRFVDAFPVNVSEITLDFSSNDQVETFTVELAYQHFTTTFGGGATGGGPGALLTR